MGRTADFDCFQPQVRRGPAGRLAVNDRIDLTHMSGRGWRLPVTRGGRWTGPACDHSCVNGPSTLRRAVCVRCLRPQLTCLCALARPTAHRTEVLVLQQQSVLVS